MIEEQYNHRADMMASRQTRESSTSTAVNTEEVFFMDVGAWQGGRNGKPKTTFGIIHKNTIALLSWLCVNKAENEIQDAFKSSPRANLKVPDKIKAFIDVPIPPERVYSNTAGKGGTLLDMYEVTGDPLTKPDEVVLFLPDMHIHAYVLHSVDRFIYKPVGDANADGLAPLDSPLRQLLDHCDKQNATTVHVGDIYEVWEVELLARWRYLNLLRIQHWLKSDYNVRIRADHKWELDNKRVYPRSFARDDLEGRVRTLSEAELQAKAIDFRSTQAICKAIREAHPEIFKRGSSKVPDGQLAKHEVFGNHDNRLANDYWPKIAPATYRACTIDTAGVLKAQTAPDTPPPDHFNTEFGSSKNPIWIEHGHIYDWHNNNRDWWLRQHGLDMVFIFVANDFYATDGLLIAGKRSSGGGETLLNFADDWTERQAYEMRFPELRRADELMTQKKNLRVIVMGHTHTPEIRRATVRGGLSATYRTPKDWAKYKDSGYYYEESPPKDQTDFWNKPRKGEPSPGPLDYMNDASEKVDSMVESAQEKAEKVKKWFSSMLE